MNRRQGIRASLFSDTGRFAMAGKLVAAGVGPHELAGVDARGVVRVFRVNVAAGPGALALDLREVLTE